MGNNGGKPGSDVKRALCHIAEQGTASGVGGGLQETEP